MAVRRVAVLGGPADAASPSHKTRFIVRDARGFFYAPAIPESQLLVYDSTGRHLRSVGRRGQGPGEYSHIVYLAGGQDSLFVFDYAGRLTVLAPDLEVARTVPIRLRPHRALPLSNGSLVVSGAQHLPDTQGQPLHLISAEGRVLRSFGYVSPRVDAGRPSLLNRKLARVDRSSFVAVRPDRYEVEQIDTSGAVQRILLRNASWFPPRDYERGPAGTRPPPYVRDISIDGSGLLWVMLYVASADWRPGIRTPGRALDPSSMDAELDTVIEVIDLENARLVATARLEIMLEGFSSDTYGFRYVEGDDGDTLVQILHLTLRPGRSGTGR